ncbi:uncharacterized protein LOC125942407 [Dermacentor silvarum]|uniref:uncharacterized protein LOC125942407 n=1 Tax=Dermacentor silvarum TaxID=543639 RepID=UPI00210177AF|nr:uncharacterized protein LOC125942407 [Dermacentor silvarum]
MICIHLHNVEDSAQIQKLTSKWGVLVRELQDDRSGHIGDGSTSGGRDEKAALKGALNQADVFQSIDQLRDELIKWIALVNRPHPIAMPKREWVGPLIDRQAIEWRTEELKVALTSRGPIGCQVRFRKVKIACSFSTARIVFLCSRPSSKRTFIEPMTATIMAGMTASRLIPSVKPAFVRGISERRSADQRIFRRAAFDRPKADQCTRSTETTEDMRRQPSCSCSIRSFLDNLRPAFSVSQQFQDFQSGCFGAEWAVFDKLVEDICDCYRQEHGRKEAMTIATGACGSQLTHSLGEMLDSVVPASNKRPVQECRPVTSPEYFIDVTGVRSRAPLRWTLLVCSEEALDCVIKNAPEPVASVFQGALQLDALCVKASNQYLVVLFIPGELAEAVLLPRFSYPLSSDPTQMQRVPIKRKLLRLEERVDPVVECRPVISAEYIIDVFGVRSRAPLRWTLLVSEEALDCVMENAPELSTAQVLAWEVSWSID